MTSLIETIKEHNLLAEASRDYYKQVDALVAKHGENTPFKYKSPMTSKLIGDIKKLAKSEKDFPQSQKTCDAVIKLMNSGIEMMEYEENIVMTNSQHGSLDKIWEGDTAFRSDLAEILMKDSILSYAIFGE